MKIKLGISIALAFLVFIFVSQNTDAVMVNFLSWSVEMTLVLLVFIMLVSGFIIGWLLNSYSRFVRNRKRTKAQENVETQNNIKTNTLVKKDETVADIQGDKGTP